MPATAHFFIVILLLMSFALDRCIFQPRRVAVKSVAIVALTAVASLLWLLPAQGQEEAAAVHEELRAFRNQLVTAVLADDIARQLELAHPQIVTMWQDGRVAAGHEGLQVFLNELGKGTDRGFLGYKQEPTPLAISTVLDDKYAFAHGTSIAHYDLYGMEFDLDNYWTATLVKDNDQWQLIGYHVSGNLADNPLLNAAKNWLYVVGGVTLLIGMLLGFLLGRRRGSVSKA
jgi:hypothetical protein